EMERALAHDLPHMEDNWGWNWSQVKAALEFLFWAGRISSAGRTPQFERRYDLPERVLPPASTASAAAAGSAETTASPGSAGHSSLPEPHDAIRELVRIAARAHG